MQDVLDVLNEHRLENERDTLEKFYASVRMRADKIDDITAKQTIIKELYDKFFNNAFPNLAKRLGIVYTPVEVVDFIIHSINDLLQSEFGQTLGSKGVHIIDPFTGTGTFVTRLLQSGLIKPEELPYKYKHEIHANEIVLLAYYIAAINIEAVYHSLLGNVASALAESGSAKESSTEAQRSALAPDAAKAAATLAQSYQPFEGICLTDTFQMYEKDDLVSDLMEHNSARRKRQKKLDIRVIMGNPPYSIGQKSENDNNANVAYPHLDERIEQTYARESSAVTAKSLYDSYIRAIRWASDRIGKNGVIGFVTNAGFVESNTTDGMRKCLAAEFSSIHIFHLRGNQRTSGEVSRREGGKIFGSGSRAPIAITLMVKNPDAKERSIIRLHDIGDYLSTEQKLARVHEFRSVKGVTNVHGWKNILPDVHGDWMKQRDGDFEKFIPMGDKKNGLAAIFTNFSQGIITSRDAWVYNFSRQSALENMRRFIAVYNQEVERFADAFRDEPSDVREAKVKGFIDSDPKRTSWSSSLIPRLLRGQKGTLIPEHLTKSSPRPFANQWLYYDGMFNHRVSQMPPIFPKAGLDNRIISISASGGTVAFSALIQNVVPGFKLAGDGGTQCFPLYLYEKATDDEDSDEGSLFAKTAAKDAPSYTRRDGISDAGLAHFQAAYSAKGEGDTITKEDLFYYIYGLLHSPDYRSRYADNLGKELPRIPAVKSFADFMAFSKAGRELAHWHLNYETVALYAGARVVTPKPMQRLTATEYRVEKMKFAKVRDPETNKSVNDKTTVFYNAHISVNDIPLEAYDYVVNGKPAIEWVMERQSVSKDKASGIINDANLWATETIGDPAYPLNLLLRVITVSLETMKTVNQLPSLNI